jgi:hypothetical protein
MVRGGRLLGGIWHRKVVLLRSLNSAPEECGDRPNKAKSAASRGLHTEKRRGSSAVRRIGLKWVYIADKVLKARVFLG